ncbi:MAG: rod shape-determining protein RodA [Thermoleophilia bacterium]|nr:rod shape-determining protein RodA [Thermoleophilia bacterium]
MATESGIWHARSRRRRPRVGADVGHVLRGLDYVLLAATAGLVAYGLWVIRAITDDDVAGDPAYFLVRQSIYVGVGAAVLVAATLVSPELLRRYRHVLFGATLALMAVVFVVGSAVRGSRRWIDFGSFQLQPSEIGKLVLIVFLAGFLAERAKRIGEAATVLATIGLAAVPTVLVFVEPDFGTALVYSVATVSVLFFAGVRFSHLAVLGVGAAGLAFALLWGLPAAGMQVLRPYQVDRLVGFLDPDSDPSGSTYNITQSITAVGAGGLDGRGVAGATQTNLNYLPEHATDFIFASLAEQRGFLGASILLLLYALVVWRGIKVVAIAGSLFGATVAGAVVGTFLFQIVLNVGMTIGIAPVTGIPLPFISYGGSSMITSLAMIGVLQAIHARGRLAGNR